MILKIHANDAQIKGEYIEIIHYSVKPWGAIIEPVLASLPCFTLDVDIITWLVVSAVAAILMIALLPGQITRLVPRVDLIQIKRYPFLNKVTVVTDDARTKRRQPVRIPEEELSAG